MYMYACISIHLCTNLCLYIYTEVDRLRIVSREHTEHNFSVPRTKARERRRAMTAVLQTPGLDTRQALSSLLSVPIDPPSTMVSTVPCGLVVRDQSPKSHRKQTADTEDELERC